MVLIRVTYSYAQSGRRNDDFNAALKLIESSESSSEPSLLCVPAYSVTAELSSKVFTSQCLDISFRAVVSHHPINSAPLNYESHIQQTRLTLAYLKLAYWNAPALSIACNILSRPLTSQSLVPASTGRTKPYFRAIFETSAVVKFSSVG